MQQHEIHQPVDGAALAARHHLGVPLKRHTHTLLRVVGAGCGVLVLAFCVLLVLAVVQMLLRQQTIIGWLILVVGIVLVIRLALLFLKADRTTARSIAYECSEGFVVVSGPGQDAHVETALRWEEVTEVWKEWEKGRRINPVKFYVRDRRGHRHLMEHGAIWKRCQKELTSRTHSEEGTGDTLPRARLMRPWL